MKKLYFQLSLASFLSGIIFTPLFAMAQNDNQAEATEEISQPEVATPSRAPAAENGQAATALPQGGAVAAPAKGEKVKTLNFEDELVEGGTQKPELFYLFQKKNFNYKRLIKLRENFLPEMRKTSEEVQRVRSQD